MLDVNAIRELHNAQFGDAPTVFVAPGRVNLIGEHTDYAEGFVMPAAIDFATLAAISPRSDGKVVLYSENFANDGRTFEANALPKTRSGHWTDYSLGVLAILASAGHTIPGFSLTLW